MKKLRNLMIGLAACLAAGMAFPGADAIGQNFGKNKVQYEKHDWEYLQSRHFDVYYYRNNRQLAEFTADVAETSYVQLQNTIRFSMSARIPIVVYNSHNDFQSTNVINELLEESVGGFTEVFKDRVVIPFQGSYEEFRHVIHHELTHAVMFQTFYGGQSGSILTGVMTSNLPLWFMEGLAEYQSLGWDTESDMYMRDATLYDYTPPIEAMVGGYIVYKGGQSLYRYLALKYGDPKIGEIVHKVRMTKDLDKALKQSIGLSTEELSKRWHRFLHQSYWPDIQDRNEPADVARRMTDHEKNRHFMNSAPALSPKGDKIAYLTDRSGFTDIHVLNTVDGKDLGKLVQGERSDLFEQMHWMRPGMKWSPDGEKLVFAAKSSGKDALYLFDVKSKTVSASFRLDLDGVFSPDWSPDGNRIAFMGIRDGRSDLYELTIADGSVQKLTDDIFSDLDPVYSPDGGRIAFVSDRGDSLSAPRGAFAMQGFDYSRTDLYLLDLKSRAVRRLTSGRSDEKSPAWAPDGRNIAFISDRSGINNIYLLDTEADTVHALTNLVSGVIHLSWSREGSRLAFSAFDNGGYDIYLMTNPMDVRPGTVEPKKTLFVSEQSREIAVRTAAADSAAADDMPPGLDVRNYVFTDRPRKGQAQGRERQSAFLDSTQYKNSLGEYKTHKYKIRFSPDVVSGGAGYSQFWGLQGSTFVRFSDILGNHQFDLYTDLFYNLKNSNFQLAYSYLPGRVDVGMSVFHFSYRYYTWFLDQGYYYFGYLRDRYYGMSLFTSRPFDRYRRVDFGITGLEIARDLVGLDENYYLYYYTFTPKEMGQISRKRLLMLNAGYTTDTAIYGSTGPMSEGRSRYSLSYSPSVSNRQGLDFWTAKADMRRYFMINRNYAFALRLAGGVSGGANPQRFLLGGMSDWINYDYREDQDIPWGDSNTDNFYFSSFETPLRGTLYYDMIGTRFMLTNLEFRFPLVQYLILGWPLPIGFQNIRGALFMDVGSAWDNDKAWKPFADGDFTLPKLNDLKGGVGFGVRMNLGYFILRYDYAKATDFTSVFGAPVHYFSFGAEY